MEGDGKGGEVRGRDSREGRAGGVYYLHCATDKYICQGMTIEELTAKIRPCERKKNAIHINWKVG